MNTPVSFPIAKLLKAKGYDKKCYKYFHSNFGKEYEYTLKGSDGELCTNWNIEKDYPQDFISAPTIAEVVMWLYEKHGIWIWVSIELGYNITFCWQLTGENMSSNYKPNFKSPTEAYEGAIEYTLNNLI